MTILSLPAECLGRKHREGAALGINYYNLRKRNHRGFVQHSLQFLCSPRDDPRLWILSLGAQTLQGSERGELQASGDHL